MNKEKERYPLKNTFRDANIEFAVKFGTEENFRNDILDRGPPMEMLDALRYVGLQYFFAATDYVAGLKNKYPYIGQSGAVVNLLNENGLLPVYFTPRHAKAYQLFYGRAADPKDQLFPDAGKPFLLQEYPQTHIGAYTVRHGARQKTRDVYIYRDDMVLSWPYECILSARNRPVDLVADLVQSYAFVQDAFFRGTVRQAGNQAQTLRRSVVAKFRFLHDTMLEHPDAEALLTVRNRQFYHAFQPDPGDGSLFYALKPRTDHPH